MRLYLLWSTAAASFNFGCLILGKVVAAGPSGAAFLAAQPSLRTQSCAVTTTSCSIRTSSAVMTTTIRGGAKREETTSIEETLDKDATTTTTTTTIPSIPPLRYLGDARLMQRQPTVTARDLPNADFVRQLEMLPRAMQLYGGIGIAAPQVGWWTRVFIFGIQGSNPRYPAAGDIPLQYWINPEITWRSTHTNWMWEGCLSVPGMRGWVERPAAITLRGWDEQGQEKEVQLDGLAARVAQHELDHLDGILFPQRVPGPEFLLPQASMEARDGWGTDWPSPGSRRTALGELCDEK